MRLPRPLRPSLTERHRALSNRPSVRRDFSVRGLPGGWASIAVLVATVGLLSLSATARAQDLNVLFPVDTIEQRLRHDDFRILNSQDTRFEGDRTQRVTLAFPDKSVMLVKWAAAPSGGAKFNNQPRYEIAAYEFQKLFLDESEYVVPPTVGRCFHVGWYRQLDPHASPTFDDGAFVLVVLQYWLYNVTADDLYDEDRFREDSAYARHLGNFNLLTYLVRHNDSNQGNFLISTDTANPRVFAVDNGVAFGPDESDRGYHWRKLHVDRLPRTTVERLRRLELSDLQEAMGVVAQFELQDGMMQPVMPGPNRDVDRGVDFTGDVLQLGLNRREIEGIHKRLQELLERVDEGKIELY